MQIHLDKRVPPGLKYDISIAFPGESSSRKRLPHMNCSRHAHRLQRNHGPLAGQQVTRFSEERHANIHEQLRFSCL